MQKGFQLGGVLGSVLVAPITLFRQSRKVRRSVLDSVKGSWSVVSLEGRQQ